MATEVLLHLTPVFETVEDGWTQATIREIPGVITAAPTHAEAEELLVDALREFLMSFGGAEPTESDTHDGMRLSLTKVT